MILSAPTPRAWVQSIAGQLRGIDLRTRIDPSVFTAAHIAKARGFDLIIRQVVGAKGE
jgi:hypothetical protein